MESVRAALPENLRGAIYFVHEGSGDQCDLTNIPVLDQLAEDNARTPVGNVKKRLNISALFRAVATSARRRKESPFK